MHSGAERRLWYRLDSSVPFLPEMRQEISDVSTLHTLHCTCTVCTVQYMCTVMMGGCGLLVCGQMYCSFTIMFTVVVQDRVIGEHKSFDHIVWAEKGDHDLLTSFLSYLSCTVVLIPSMVFGLAWSVCRFDWSIFCMRSSLMLHVFLTVSSSVVYIYSALFYLMATM